MSYAPVDDVNGKTISPPSCKDLPSASRSTTNFIKITSGNCTTNGYSDLISRHECSQATGGTVRSLHTQDDIFGCAEGTTWNDFNSYTNSLTIENISWIDAMWCKE